jgi:ankyrin repeat protein
MPFTKQQADSLIKSFDSITSENQAIQIAMQMKEALLNTDTLDGDKFGINHLAKHLMRGLAGSAYQSSFKSIMQLVEIHTAENINAHDAEGKTFLYWAFQYGDVSLIELLIYKYGANINAPQDENGNTLLHLASKKNDIETIKRLHKYQANINARNKFDETPLHLAIEFGNFQTVKFLVEKKANVHAKDSNQNTPLNYISKTTPIESIRLLIAQGAEINAPNITKVTPIHNAAWWDRVDILRVLIEDYSANKKLVNIYGTTLLHFSEAYETARFLIEGNHLRADVLNIHGEEALFPLATKAVCKTFIYVLAKIKEINKSFDINKQGFNQRTLLHVAALNGHVNLVEYLIETQHAQFDIEDEQGNIPLHLACHNNHFEVVQKLVNRTGAKINARNKKNATPLHRAASGANIQLLDFLLKHDADIHAQDSDGGFPWHYAAETGKVENLKYLINKIETGPGFNINALYLLQQTALHFAAGCSFECVKFLLEKGINFNLLNNFNQNALHLAARKGQYSTVKHLVNVCKMDIFTRDANNDACLHHAAISGDLKTVKFLIQKAKSQNKFNIEMRGYYKRTLLHTASHYGHKPLVELFLNMSADPAAEDEEGYGVLDFTAQEGNLDVVRYLSEPPHCIPPIFKKRNTLKFALMNQHLPVVKYLVKDHKLSPSKIKLAESGTALHGVAENGSVPLAEFLVRECKISVNCKTIFNITPLHIAAAKNHVDLMKFLVEEGADVNAQDIFKEPNQKKPDDNAVPDETPLFKAVKANHMDATRLLLKAGGNINIEDGAGDNIFDFETIPPEIYYLITDFDNGILRNSKIYKIFLSTIFISSTPLDEDTQGEVFNYFGNKETGAAFDLSKISEDLSNKITIVLVEELLLALVESVDKFKSNNAKIICIENAVNEMISELLSDYSKAECYQYWDELKLELRCARNKKQSRDLLKIALMKVERPSKLPSGPLMSLPMVKSILKSHSNTVVATVKSEVKERETKHSKHSETITEEQELAQAIELSMNPSLATATPSSSSSSSNLEMLVCNIETKTESKQEISSSSSSTSVLTVQQQDIEMLPQLEPAHIFLQQDRTKTSYGASWWWQLKELSVDRGKRKAEDQITSAKSGKQERNLAGLFAQSKSLVNEEAASDAVRMVLG